jgi:hypothetical protein
LAGGRDGSHLRQVGLETVAFGQQGPTGLDRLGVGGLDVAQLRGVGLGRGGELGVLGLQLVEVGLQLARLGGALPGGAQLRLQPSQLGPLPRARRLRRGGGRRRGRRLILQLAELKDGGAQLFAQLVGLRIGEGPARAQGSSPRRPVVSGP